MAEDAQTSFSVKEVLDTFKKDNAKDHDEMWSAINSLRNRLPLWAVATITLMGSAIGYLIKAIY